MGEVLQTYENDVLSYLDPSEVDLFSGEEVDFRNPYLACISRAFATGMIYWETRETGTLSPDTYSRCLSMGLLESEVRGCVDRGLILPFPSMSGEMPDFPYPYETRKYEHVFDMYTPLEKKGTACIVGGKFDVLTIAHVSYIKTLKMLFDKVFVVLASDRECRASGGKERPIWPFVFRVANLRLLGVDKVIEGGDVLDLIDLNLPFPLFCLSGLIATRLEVGRSGTRLVIPDPDDLFFQGYPATPGVIEHIFTEDEIRNPQKTIAENSLIARHVENFRHSLPYRGMAYCVTEGDPREAYKYFIAAITGMNFRLIPNLFPDVHSSDVIDTFGIMGLDDVRYLL